jgi:hypothetical protein
MRSSVVWISLTAIWVLATAFGTAAAGEPISAVPEPTSLALLAVGLGGAAWVKFRRRR